MGQISVAFPSGEQRHLLYLHGMLQGSRHRAIQMDEGNPFKAPARYDGGGTHENATFKLQITNNPYMLPDV